MKFVQKCMFAPRNCKQAMTVEHALSMVAVYAEKHRGVVLARLDHNHSANRHDDEAWPHARTSSSRRAQGERSSVDERRSPWYMCGECVLAIARRIVSSFACDNTPAFQLLVERIRSPSWTMGCLSAYEHLYVCRVICM